MKYFCALIIFGLILSACSSSTGNRYSKNKEEKEIREKEIKNVEMKEDFDITPYKTEIKLPPSAEINTNTDAPDAWFEYENSPNDGTKSISGTTDGYRVLVVSTDNIDEANQLRSDLYSSTRKEVYIDFEPPFYKVKVGDFSESDQAEDLRFKLNQMGYNESRVVRETINIYE